MTLFALFNLINPIARANLFQEAILSVVLSLFYDVLGLRFLGVFTPRMLLRALIWGWRARPVD